MPNRITIKSNRGPDEPELFSFGRENVEAPRGLRKRTLSVLRVGSGATARKKPAGSVRGALAGKATGASPRLRGRN